MFESLVILLGLLPSGSAQISPIEVVVSTGVLLTVLLERRLVSGQTVLVQLEGILAGV